MKLKAVLAVILLFSGIGFRAAAQYNIDYDIQAIRQLSFPEFINEFGNYTQYVPGVGLLTLKLSGVKGRTNWARFSTSVATSAILVAGASFGLKEITGRERPNGADKRSIPSGHSVLAFASAAALHKEYGWRSPWYSIGGYSFAMLTAVQRIATNWHWMGDTMFGMVLGIGGVELGYFLNDLFWKEKGYSKIYEDRDILASFADSWQVEWIYGTRIFCCPQTDIHSSAVPMRGGEAALQFTMPWHRMARSGPEELGVRLRTAASSMRYNNSGKDHDEFSFLGGASWTFPLSERFGFDVYTLCGAALARGSWKPELVAGTSMGLLTSGFYKLKLFAEADWFPTSSPLSFVTGFSLSFCL